MGRGQKRGRTQRRHFKQNRDNVWKHNPGKPSAAADTADAPTEENVKWEPFATQNPGFDEYYKEQRIVREEEWDEFIASLRSPLPAAFRINASGQFSEDIQSQLQNEFTKFLEAEANNENGEEAIRPLSWYPGNLAWQLNFSRMQLRKNQALEGFHEFLKQENEVGNITRQEAVSMVPPLFLNVMPEHHILDMCAAPGSKTFQLLEIIHGFTKTGQLPKGLVIANDVDVQRCNLLIHQTKRMSTANLIVTNHEAQHFPSISMGKDGQVGRSSLLFDRVLCDVPCSGDGTLRKAPDIWRKWNAGMGNGLHCLQVVIAMRGLALLKVGGRMVYSTCSMNPVENEAVVAEILRRCEGSVELLDVSNELPGLVRRPGLKTWKVRDKGSWFTTYKDIPVHRKNGAIVQSMFPSGLSWKETLNEGATNHLTEAPISEESKESDASSHLSEMEVSELPLERCMRIVPHDQNSGAFFIAVFQKISPLPANHSTNKQTKSKQRDKSHMNVKVKEGSEIQKAEDVREISIDSVVTEGNTEMISENKDLEAEPLLDDNEQNGVQKSKTDNKKKKLPMQGNWRGVDPVVFFTDETIINSIISFYGVCEGFPLAGHLVVRNDESTLVKRIYYVSRSVRDILQLNLQVGQRLKITSLGLKIFERQTAKDGSPCYYRISSEGLQLLLPYLTKQIVYASFSDFEHLLKYRAVKFVDFVDSTLAEKASALLPGCCVVVLRQENNNADITVDASTIAIICWKGKSNLSIMVSASDAKELLERLEIRHGKKDITASVLEKSLLKGDSVAPLDDAEAVDGTENMEEEPAI
ncbi:tRNA (cytosine(34)-C(5))-methyltransferase-like protein [Carex littledalei]|uniref:tRNA (Cytosine(34)-C(5))-methyltransferase-like protein n=1 Tax=Carex littledalei TaxID=544730 RepID=A0A833R1N1_9POAL|nr:tRNA (cytosine(34)-C(5))-methyltransferase-like protein [Carex littledalei]